MESNYDFIKNYPELIKYFVLSHNNMMIEKAFSSISFFSFNREGNWAFTKCLICYYSLIYKLLQKDWRVF